MTWLLPTKGRIGNLRRMCRAFREYGIGTPGLVLVNRDEFDAKKHEYATLDLPPNWTVVSVEATCMQDALRCAWPMVKDAQWIGLLQDDVTPGTPGWDDQLIKKIRGWNVVSAFDGRSNRMHGAIVWSGDLLRAMAWDAPYPPGLKHLYGDDVWETLGREAGCWSLDQSVVTPHHNETYTVNADDTAKSIAAHTEHDKARYEGWLSNSKDDCVRRIKELKTAKGAHEIAVNVSGISILIATPSVSNRPEESYTQSVAETMGRLHQMGVPCAKSVEKYNADVALARSNLFSVFLRSPFTHMLMVDDDMDWDFSAVLRLIGAKKDFVAVAGPKKSYPPRFAANHTDDFENVIPLQLDQATGTCEVTEVGAAFCLLSKTAAQKFAQSYPELHYATAGGETNVAAFLGMVHRGRYKAEDFAFCRRLRAIGFKTYICPDVPLGHTGAHRYFGDLWSAATNQAKRTPPGDPGRATISGGRMSLANLFNNPTNEPNIWSFSNQDQHRAIVDSVRDNFGLRLNLYPLEPFPIEGDINGWLRAHQTMHNEFTSLLGLQGFDLTGLDLNDERIMQAWTWVHATEHRDAAQLLGI